MTTSTLNTKITYPVRSNSFPSKPHPFIAEVDEHLCRLKSAEASSSSSSSAISHQLSGLQDLHDCIDKLLLLPQSHQVQESDKKWIDELLEGSLRLLDLCCIAKDSLSQIMECTHELQSILRRRKTGFEIELRNFMKSRKMVKKAIKKAVKGTESKRVEKSHEIQAVVSMLREVEAVTLSTVESLLSFVSGSKSSSKLSGWSFVSKLVHSKRIEREDEEANRNEHEMVDAALHSITSQKITTKSDSVEEIENLLNLLGKSESSIRDLEENLERLYRHLIKTRVSLLNFFNH